jgi:hypothetical protein
MIIVTDGLELVTPTPSVAQFIRIGTVYLLHKELRQALLFPSANNGVCDNYKGTTTCESNGESNRRGFRNCENKACFRQVP